MKILGKFGAIGCNLCSASIFAEQRMKIKAIGVKNNLVQQICGYWSHSHWQRFPAVFYPISKGKKLDKQIFDIVGAPLPVMDDRLFMYV